MRPGIRLKLSLLALTGLALLLGLTWLGVRSSAGQRFIQERVSAWLEQTYDLHVQYRSLEVHASTFGWRWHIHDLHWADAERPEQAHAEIRSLLIDASPWRYLLGQSPVAAVAVDGAQLQLTAELLKKFLKSPDQEQKPSPWLTDVAVRLDDVAVGLDYPVDQQTESLQLQLAVTRENGAFTRLDAASPGFDLMALAAVFDLAERLQPLKRGRVERLVVQCQGLDNCRGSAGMREVELAQKNWIPGVRTVAAELEFQPQTLLVKLPRNAYRLDWRKVYSETLAVDLPAIQLALRYNSEAIQIHVPSTGLVWNGVPARANADVRIPLQAPEKTQLRLAVRVGYAPWPKFREALPDQIFGLALNDWLRLRLRGGLVKMQPHRSRAKS